MKIVGVDAESEGLLGAIWAIGAVAIGEVEDDSRCEIFALFEGRTSYPPRDPWVFENIWPVCQVLTPHSRSVMLEWFWDWWRRRAQEGYIAVADFGVPVEARLFRDCMIDEHPRWFEGPYPLHELGTLLLAAGRDPDMPREELAREVGMAEFVKHNPVHDAEMTARAAYMLLKQLEKARER